MFVTNKKFTTTIVKITECLEAIRDALQDHKENIESLNDEIKSFRKYSSDLASRIVSNEEMIDNLFSRVYALESKNKTNKKATIKTTTKTKRK